MLHLPRPLSHCNMQRINNRTATLSELAKTIAIPADYPPHRMPTFPALERTAVLSFADTASPDWPAGLSNSYYMLSRDPGYPLWAQKYISTAGSQYGYSSSFSLSIGVSPNDTLGVTVGDVIPTVSSGEFDSVKYPILKFEGKTYFLLGGEATTGTATPIGAVSFDVTAGSIYRVNVVATFLDEFLSPQQIDFGASNPTVSGSIYSLTLQFPANAIGFRVESVSVQAGAGGLTYTTCAVGVCTGNSANPLYSPTSATIYRLLPYGTPPEHQTAPLIWQNSRCTASSLLLTNVTAVMSKEGTAAGARVNVQSFPALRPSQWAGFSAVHPADRYFGAMENGLYAFTLPDVTSEEFRDCVVTATNQYSGAVTSCGMIDMAVLRYATCIHLCDTNAMTGVSIALTLARHIEFRTTSRLFPTAFSREPLETYHASQMALVTMGTIMENPTHLTAIARMTTSAVRSVGRKGGKQQGPKEPKRSNAVPGKMTQKTLAPPPSDGKKKQKPPPKKGKK